MKARKQPESGSIPDRRSRQPSGRLPVGPHLWQITAVRELVLILLIGFAAWFLYSLSAIFLPIFIALVLAHVFNPLVSRLETTWHWPRPVTISLLLALAAIALFGFFAWLSPLLVGQLTRLGAKLPDYLRTLASTYNIEFGDLIGRVEQSIGDGQIEPKQILSQIFKTTGQAVGIVKSILGVASYAIFSIALVLVYFFFFSWHFNRGLAHLGRYVPESREERTHSIVKKMDGAVGEFFRGRLVISLIMGILLSAGWFLAGVPYWFFLGMLTGLLNIIPYFSVVTWPLAVLLTYVDTITDGGGQSPGLLSIILWPSAVYFAVQLLESWVLTPWIQSGQMKMSAVTIILVVFIGGAFGGVLGLLFAIPVAACIKILFEELVLPPLKRWAASH